MQGSRNKRRWLDPLRLRPRKPRLLKGAEHSISPQAVDPDALKIIHRLRGFGFVAYLTGGAVQNLLQGIAPKDFDIVTNARPGQIKKRFSNAFIIGRRFRLAHLHFKGGKIIEVATFRRDPKAAEEDRDETVPAWKSTYGTPREDAFRRDISINALFYDVDSDTVIDYVDGLKDLAERRIRIIGDPGERYTEDPVRMLRVVRHAARLGFEIDKKSESALFTHRHLLAEVSGARLFEELNKDMSGQTRPIFKTLRRYELFQYLLGRIGEDYQNDDSMYQRLETLLSVRDKARADGLPLTQEDIYALILKPWMEANLPQERADLHQLLNSAVIQSPIGATVPRSLRTAGIQIVILMHHLEQALVTGRVRQSWRHRAHFAAASRLLVMTKRGRAPLPGESFDSLYREAFPGREKTGRSRRRRSRRHKTRSAPTASGAQRGGDSISPGKPRKS